ncbi:hypothetical protein HEK131_08410 [Streptomyces seoulensis]|nr:hypothetical protein HEK131_08410 [Streptomyces seoulensis]
MGADSLDPVAEDAARASAELLKAAGPHGHKHATVAEMALRQPGPVAMVTSDVDDTARLCGGPCTPHRYLIGGATSRAARDRFTGLWSGQHSSLQAPMGLSWLQTTGVALHTVGVPAPKVACQVTGDGMTR